MDGGPNNNPGWLPYSRGHEVDADLGPAGNRTEVFATNFAINFAITGAANVSVTPDWTNTTDIRVRQSIDRTAGFDANWTGSDLDLVSDFLGIDTRTGNGGNGNWDGINGVPTFLTLTLSGLAAGTYNWTSCHHDTEHLHGTFAVWLDTGAGFLLRQRR